MAIKDIFNMVKAARYTQDGRDQITEALENETEDVRYKPGDISQKTGLQKQPDGSWAEPKKGAPAENVTKMSDLVAQKSRPESAPAGRQPTPEMLEREKMRQSPEAIAHKEQLEREHPRTETGASAETKKEFSNEDKINMLSNYMHMMYKDVPVSEWKETYSKLSESEIKESFENFASNHSPENYSNGGKYDYASRESAPAKTPKPTTQEYMKAKDRVKKYEEQYKKDMEDYEYMERVKANGVDTSIFNPMYGGKPRPLSENKDYIEEVNKIKAYEAKDAAPRQLTGDCKIKIKKS